MRGDLTIDYARRLVTVAGLPVQLTATEYNLLVELSVHLSLRPFVSGGFQFYCPGVPEFLVLIG